MKKIQNVLKRIFYANNQIHISLLLIFFIKIKNSELNMNKFTNFCSWIRFNIEYKL